MTTEQIKQIVNNICYTKKTYSYINKKLKKDYSPQKIRALIRKAIFKATQLEQNGEYISIYTPASNLKIIINSHDFHIIAIMKTKKLSTENESPNMVMLGSALRIRNLKIKLNF